MAGTQLETGAVSPSRCLMHSLPRIGVFAGLLFVATLVNWSFPGIYGRGPAFPIIMLALATFTGLCLSLGAGCLAVLIFSCSLAALRIYKGYPVETYVMHEMLWRSIWLMMFLLVVHAGRWIARRIERAWSIGTGRPAAARETPAGDDAEQSSSGS